MHSESPANTPQNPRLQQEIDAKLKEGRSKTFGSKVWRTTRNNVWPCLAKGGSSYVRLRQQQDSLTRCPWDIDIINVYSHLEDSGSVDSETHSEGEEQGPDSEPEDACCRTACKAAEEELSQNSPLEK